MKDVLVLNEAACMNCGHSETMGGCRCEPKIEASGESSITTNEQRWADWYSEDGSPSGYESKPERRARKRDERKSTESNRLVFNSTGGHAGAPEGALGIPVWRW